MDIPTEGAEAWIVEFLKEIDKLLDGDAFSQHDAYIRLQSYKDKVGYNTTCGFFYSDVKCLLRVILFYSIISLFSWKIFAGFGGALQKRLIWKPRLPVKLGIMR